MKMLLKILFFTVCAIVGGVVGTMVAPYFTDGQRVTPDQAVSVANTYIVFTTFIFVAFTVLLGIAGYIFMHLLTEHRKVQETQAIDDVKLRLKNDGKLCLDILQQILHNREVQRNIDSAIREQLERALNEERSDLVETSRTAADKLQRVVQISARLQAKPNGSEPTDSEDKS